jgi:hypothetical protein
MTPNQAKSVPIALVGRLEEDTVTLRFSSQRPLLLLTLAGVTVVESCTLIADIDRNKIPDVEVGGAGPAGGKGGVASGGVNPGDGGMPSVEAGVGGVPSLGGTGTGGAVSGTTGGKAATGGAPSSGGANTGGKSGTGGAPSSGGASTMGGAGSDSGGAGSDSGGAGAGGEAGFAGEGGAGPVSTGGVSTGGVSTGGVSTGGVSTGGVSTGGVSTGGVSTGGVSTGGAVTGGANSGGAQGEGGASGDGPVSGGSPSLGGDTGNAGAGGAGGSSSATGWPFDSDAESWQTLWLDAGNGSPALSAGDVSLSWVAAGGDVGGALEVTIGYSDPDQYVGIGVDLSAAPLDLSHHVLIAHLAQTSGFVDPGDVVAKLYVSSGSAGVYANGAVVSIDAEADWLTLTLDLDAPEFADSGFDAADIRELGVELDTSSTNANPTTSTFSIDTVTY